MFLGHYGIAFAARRIAPRTSLGTTIFAAQFLNELWPILILAGVERVSIIPGLMPASSLEFVSFPYSHSLAAAICWSILIAVAYYAIRWYRRGTLVVGAAVLSHWMLDLPMHQTDLQLWPGSPIFLGFGLWRSLPLTVIIELSVYVLGLVLYLRGTRARDRIGSWGLWAMVALLAAFFASSLTAAPPPNEQMLAVMTLGLWLFVPWGYWVDRHRENIVREARA